MMPDASLIFQRDGGLLVTPGEGMHEILSDVRLCAQLRSIVAGNHVYAISPSALWGAAARGINAAELIDRLARWSPMEMPVATAAKIADSMGRFGAIEVVDGRSGPLIVARDLSTFDQIGVARPADGTSAVSLEPRDVAPIKLAAVRAGWPVVDRRRIVTSLTTVSIRDDVRLRPYQRDALAAFEAGRDGMILLPCGAGKTLVGIAAAAATGGPVLVLAPSRTIGEQWQSAFATATNCTAGDVGWFGHDERVRLLTTATYQTVTSSKRAGELIGRRWSLVIYDEAQSLPAAVFRLAAGIESDRRLGLSATLVREDGRESEVFALIGPPLFEASWLELERDGWIAPARCTEVRIPPAATRTDIWRYKMAVAQRLLERHSGESTIIAGTSVANLRATGHRLGIPVLTGDTPAEVRAEQFAAFRSGVLKTIGVSRIGSVGVDLPDASVLIQLSGTFGSRQEEAQRLGRLLRPAAGKTAWFYTIVATGTREEHFAERRQRYLVNQGYQYEIIEASSLPRSMRSG